MDLSATKHVIEACLLVAGREMSLVQLAALFEEDEDRPGRDGIRAALDALHDDYASRGIELVEVASGWRLQSRASMVPWVSRLFQERAPRYSRALLETLVLIAYRQPVTRGEIEEVRGVAVSSSIVKTLHERDWIREVGHKDVPGKPALLGTTRQFLDYFNLKRLEDLPSLVDLEDPESLETALASKLGVVDGVGDGQAANDGDGAEIESVPETVEGVGSEPSPVSGPPSVSEPESVQPSDASSRAETPDDARPAAGSESDANAMAADRAGAERVSEPATRERVTGLPAPPARSAGEPVDFERYRRAAALSDTGNAGVPSESESESEGGSAAGSESESEGGSEAESKSGSGDPPSNDSRSRLLRVIDAFAAEHRQDLDDPDGADPAVSDADPRPGVDPDVDPNPTGSVDPESGQTPPERDDGIP